jgi:hypothetical protein
VKYPDLPMHGQEIEVGALWKTLDGGAILAAGGEAMSRSDPQSSVKRQDEKSGTCGLSRNPSVRVGPAGTPTGE